MMKRLSNAANRAHRDEGGQMAFLMVLTLVVLVMLFAVALDTGIWALDHRTAQNQAEAAALAAAGELPDTDTTDATSAAVTWLARNGSSDAELCGDPDYDDVDGDGEYDLVRVCVERESDAIFSQLVGVDWAQISADATAQVGHATGSNVFPWAVIPPDPDCGFNESCSSGDLDGDGDVNGNGECEGDFDDCPWGLSPGLVLGFKSGGGGNTGVVDVCGAGNSSYVDCIEGETHSGFFEEGDDVLVGLQGGNLGINTHNALTERFGPDALEQCDLDVFPNPDTGFDASGYSAALDLFDYDLNPTCAQRAVVLPILYSIPDQGGGSESLTVLGVAVFGITSWNRENNKDAWGTDSTTCTPQQGGQPPDDEYNCGMVWGFLLPATHQPPDFLLEEISDTPNPFAPLLIALVE